MTSAAGDSVTYGLYRNSAGNQLWGSAASSLGVTGTGSGANLALTVYGVVPAQATPKPGVYSDRVVATITY